MSADSDPRNLIINYIPTPLTNAELRQLFEQYGQVESARIIVDRMSNHPKGYGFVKFKTEDAARTAIEKMNGFEIYNKRLRVTPARGPNSAQINNYALKMALLQDGVGVSQVSLEPSASSPPPPAALVRIGQDGLHGYQTYPLVPALPATGAFAIVDGVPMQVVQAPGPHLITATPQQIAMQPNFSQVNNGVNTASGSLLATQVMNSSKVSLQVQQQQQQQQTPYGTTLQPLFVQSFGPMTQLVDPIAHGGLQVSLTGDPNSVPMNISLNSVVSRAGGGESTGIAC